MESRRDNSFVVINLCNSAYIDDKWHDAFLRSYKQKFNTATSVTQVKKKRIAKKKVKRKKDTQNEQTLIIEKRLKYK